MRAISCRTRAAPRTSLAASPRPLVSSRVGSSETVARHRRLFATAPIACSRRLVPALVSHHPLALIGTLPSAQRQTLHNVIGRSGSSALFGRPVMRRNLSSSAHREFVFRLSPEGGLTEDQITIQDLMSSIPGLMSRDLKNVDSTTNRQISSIIVRDEFLIVKLEYLRLILLDAKNPVIAEFARFLQFDMTIRSEEAFEFRVLGAMLANVIRDFEDRLRLLELLITKSTSAFEALEHIDDALIRFLPMKKGIGGFNTSVKEYQSALKDLLASDEDLANLYVTYKAQTGKARLASDHAEAEILMERYAKRGEEILNEIAELRADIDATENVINMSLDSQRNHLIRLNLQVSFTSMACGAGSVIAGIFGMNLHNGLEHDPQAFPIAVMGICWTGMLLCFFWVWLYNRNVRRVQHLSQRVATNRTFARINSIEFRRELYAGTNLSKWRQLLEDVLGRPPTALELQSFERFDRNLDGRLGEAELMEALHTKGDKVKSGSDGHKL